MGEEHICADHPDDSHSWTSFRVIHTAEDSDSWSRLTVEDRVDSETITFTCTGAPLQAFKYAKRSFRTTRDSKEFPLVVPANVEGDMLNILLSYFRYLDHLPLCSVR
jgi:meiotically up-regulated gene 157 (Mug157) protein